ncbi:E3 ubiquitin-protein ligase HUWE1 isoform X2 [Episyrphus balteatus]|uniref:E3 ubiquitin-protein ligase HUWE1 isoform X2 n=1 Tax=Episyrphus balteatus TaxID=286459 RepID=UPI002484DB4C|nr:E3 ubiquitin-protein ligase HUWE1 isoform X2 [Episyrphus balteatus]
MKVDTNRLKKGTSELTPECRQLIEDMNSRKTRKELLEYLEKLRGWVYGKCELYHWIELLDRFDDILAEAAKENPDNEFALYCDTNYTPSDVRLLLYVINFTTLLIEHSFSRHLYNSIEHLTQLLSSTNMDIVMCVLNLLYMFSKRSNFIPRLNSTKKVSLLNKLFNFAESWGGKENGFSLAQCCKKDARLPRSSSTLYFEYYNAGGQLDFIEVPGLDRIKESPASMAKIVCDKIPHLGDDQRMHILTRIRLAATFHNYRMRLQFVQARLQAISVLVYSNAILDNIHNLLYPGFLEELVELLEVKDIHLVEIRAAALRTLTSIIHLDRNPHFPKKPGSRLSKIIEVTGAALYHGFLPTLVRACINHLISIQAKENDVVASYSVMHQYTFAYENTNITEFDLFKQTNQFPLSLATALFSFLYHLASYEAGGEALVACGMMESLLRVINWPGADLEHITFVTRAVRVIDLITNIDMHTFHSNNGLGAFIQRLETEVHHCRQDQQDGKKKRKRRTAEIDYMNKHDIIKSPIREGEEDSDMTDAEGIGLEFENERDKDDNEDSNISSESDTKSLHYNEPGSSSSNASTSTSKKDTDSNEKDKKIACVTQRAALLKSMLNFLKKSIQDSAYNSGMRNVMESSLPRSLRNIISNADYYGPSLFLLATDVVTVYVFQEPSLLCTLQDSGLTDIVLRSLLRKEVPATREVLGSLPNVFSALCLNARGLEEFSSYHPFDRLFQVLLSPDYLIAMRRRRSSDPLGDTATNLGNAMDDLIKHHPSLRTDATKSIIKLLTELVRIGSDPHFICWRANNNNAKSDTGSTSQSNAARNANKDNGNGSSGEDDDDEEISSASQQRSSNRNENAASSSRTSFTQSTTYQQHSGTTPEEREPVPLIDYILNVMKFLDAIISNGTNGEHCREFVSLGGLQPLLSILSLPNLPVDSPVTTTAQAVATVCKSVLNLAHETKVIEVAIEQLSQVVEKLNPLVVHMNSPEKSILLKELTNCPRMEAGFSNADYTPLLHAMSAVHGYVVMLVHICRSSQNDVRMLLLRKWGIDCARGKKLLQSLVQLYTSLVWESTILLGMCSEDNANAAKGPEFNYDESINRIQTELRRDTVDISEESSDQTPSTSAASAAAVNQQSVSDASSASEAILQQASSSARGVDMEIDDDVICLTPFPSSSSSQTVPTNDEAISIDSTTSSSDSVVYVPNRSDPGKDDTETKCSSDQASSEKPDGDTKRREKGAPGQLRYIKALLAASSRLGRALAELFGNLVKLCVGTPGRQRRTNELLSTANFPCTEAGDIARVLSYILVNGFCYEKIVSPSVPKLKLTFLICSVGFTGPMLFDEKRYAFHLMLSQFCEEGGLEAFFDMFKWALSYGCADEDKESFIKGNEYAEGTGEFLDAWLLLLEKMVNPRAIFESPHYITSRPTSGPTGQLLEFEPVFYMVKVHSLALNALSDIWDKKPLPNYGIRMAESIMAIMKHILKNETMLREKYQKRKEEIKKVEEEGEARKNYRDSIKKSVNLNHLKLFMDMGFSEVHVSEALAVTNSVEQATDFLLNRPESSGNASASAMSRLLSFEQELDDDDEDDNDEADGDGSEIEVVNRTNKPTNTDKNTADMNEQVENPATEKTPEITESKNKTTWKSVQLPDAVAIDNFCREALKKTFNTMDQLPETVTSGADLLAVLYRRHTPDMKHKFLLTLVQNITDWAEKMLHNLKARDALNSSKREEILIGRYGIKLYIRLKVGCLLLDDIYKDMRKTFCMAIRHEKSLSTLIMLLHKIESILQEHIALGAPPITPRWLQHLIEFIDSIDNACHIMQRKTNMLAVTTKIWKWFDSPAGKWNAYSNTNNEIIHKAFVAGERSVRITCGRQKYTINFNCMSQVNEATGNHRPIILGLKVTDLADGSSKIESSIITSETSSDSDSGDQSETADQSAVNTRSAGSQAAADILPHSRSSSDGGSIDSIAVGNTESRLSGLFEIDDDSKLEEEITEGGVGVETSASGLNKIVLHEEPTGLQQYDTGAIVSCLARLMRPKLAIDLDTINSILKLCVKLTKDAESAKVFANNGGINLLLSMRQMCGYMGFPTYAILLIRHVLEEPQTLLATMERVIASRTMSVIPSNHRDLIFVLRQMSSAVSRDPKTFMRAASNVLRLDSNIMKGNDDTRLIVKASVLIRKAAATGTSSSASTSTADDNVASCSNVHSATENDIATSVIKDLLKALLLPCIHFPPPPAARALFKEKTQLTFGGLTSTSKASSSNSATDASSFEKTPSDDSQSDQCCGWHVPSSSHLHDKPLLTRSTILKILADAVRSYQTFAPKLITEHVYYAKDSVLIKQDQSALSFILDNFLPLKENCQDREVSTMARVLITSLSDCVDQLSIQNTVISEVKSAIQRAINLPECSDKHMRLQVFVGLLPTTIDNPMPLNKITPHRRNEILLILLRKGIMTDLAKMILHLDLSNPNSVTTLNAVLKPMETLLRLTISPGLSAKKKTSQLQCDRRNRDQLLNATQGSNGGTTTIHTLSRRSTNDLDGDHIILDVMADRPRASGFFFTGDSRTSEQFNNIFDGILGNDQEFFNDGVLRHLNDDAESPNADVAFETSSESSDSESNASEDNDERDGDDDDGNEEHGEERSEADADEETRQFIEIFDHAYAPDQPRATTSDRRLDGVPIIRYTVSSNLNPSGSGTSSGASTSGAGSASNLDNLVLVHQTRPRNTNASVLSRSFNPIHQQQLPSINIGIVRSSPATGPSTSARNNNSIDDDLIARFNYYIHHGQTLSSGSGSGSNPTVPSSISNLTAGGGGLGSSSTVQFGTNAGITVGGGGAEDTSEGRVPSSTNRLQRDSRRLLLVDQQYCTSHSFNNSDENQNELFNQDALHWWLEEAKHLDMESQPDICLTVAHQLIPVLQELRAKTKRRKRKTASIITQAGSIDESTKTQESSGISTPSVNITTPATVQNSSSPSNRRSAIPILLPRNSDSRDAANPSSDIVDPIIEFNSLNDEDNDNPDLDTSGARRMQASNDRESPLATSQNETTDPEVVEESGDDSNSDGEPLTPQETSQTGRQSNQSLVTSAANLRQRITEEMAVAALAEAALVPLPDDDEDEEEEEEEEEEVEADERQENDENDDDNEEEGEDEELNVEDVIMDFDDEIQNVLSQFSAPAPQEIASESMVHSYSSVSQNAEAGSDQSDRITENISEPSSEPSAASTTALSSDAGALASTSSADINNASPSLTTIAGGSSSSNRAAASGTAASSSRNNEMSPEVRLVLGDLQIPEGVDPSFLAALPSEMREEVIQEHLRAQRNRQRAQQNAIETEHESLIEVNPDFLAALPPSIQAEVLSQQRIEQQRQAAQTANPNDPVDAAAFFQNLQPSLRQAILTDMEDSQIASLPPDLVAEAQNLRRDWEHRNRQTLHERLVTHSQANSTPAIGGTAYIPPRIPSIQNLRGRPSWHVWYNSHSSSSNGPGEGNFQKLQGKPVALALMETEGSLLDVDALSSLLLMLFIDDAKFNILRLHRVIRHLCYHAGTREWIIDSLISIIKMADKTDITRTDGKLISRPQYLTLRVDAALGYRSSVFLIKRGIEQPFKEESYCGGEGNAIRIHPQAAQMVCRNSLDLLITLARYFPGDFVPFRETESIADKTDTINTKLRVDKDGGGGGQSSPQNPSANSSLTSAGVWCTNIAKKPKISHTPSSLSATPSSSKDEDPKSSTSSKSTGAAKKKTPSIFDVLLKLDCTTRPFQSSSTSTGSSSSSSKEVASAFLLNPQPNRGKLDFLSYEDSPFAQLMSLLPTSVVKRSQQLTDKLVRLLASLGLELPKEDKITPVAMDDDLTDTTETAPSSKPPATATALASETPVIPVAKAQVIDVHDSDSEPDAITGSDDDEDSGSGGDGDSFKTNKPYVKKPRSILLYPSKIQQLKIAIEVLTTKSCSEEGLEYVTDLIVHLSQCSAKANAIVDQLLIQGVMGLAELVRMQILCLMKEVKENNLKTITKETDSNAAGGANKSSSSQSSSSSKSLTTPRGGGIINDRFTAAQVVISAPSKSKPTCELQLPSMSPLLTKSSSQTFFLRTLKVFMQVRDFVVFQNSVTKLEPLSEIICLNELWDTLSECLVHLEKTNDQHAVLILQPAVEAFFLIHASKKKQAVKTFRPSTHRSDTFPITRRPLGGGASASSSSAAAAAPGPIPNTLAFGINERMPPRNAQSSSGNNSIEGESSEQESTDLAAAAVEGIVDNPSPLTGAAGSSKTETTAPSTSGAATAAAKEAEIQRRDQKKFLEFAEKHRTVLNQILRQSATHLSDGPFSVLVDHTRILDFDVKRKYFRTELERMDEGVRREELTVNVRRVTVFEDSFRELYRRGPEEWKNRFYIVFEDEEGQDAGGLLREWYVIISREIFNPMYALFCVSPGDRVTYMINPSSHANPNHLCYFKFVGRVIAKAIHDNKLLECYFTRSFYKHILGIQVKYTDMESQDYEFYKGLAYLMSNDISSLGYDLTFSTEVQEFGVTQIRDLVPNGRNITVTEKNKFDYIRLVCQLKMSGSIRQQLNAFLEGFYDIIPKRLISIFNEQELELLISGLPNVDIEDLKQNTEYHKYNSKSPQIQWFWRALRSFDQADRAKFLQFVTGTSKVPLQGFSALEGMNGIQKFQIHRDDRSTDRLPCAHTCFNQLDLPLYKSFEKLRTCLTKAIHECSEGFGFA